MKQNEKKMRYAFDGLALPEIRFDAEEEEATDREETKEIVYENVAIPEIHVKKKNS